MTLIITDRDIHPDWVRSPSGLILSEDAARLRYAPPKHPQGGDVFSGCGGFACGAKAAGFQMRFAVEWDVQAAVTYMINLGAYPCTLHIETAKLKAKFEKAVTHKDKKTGLTTVLRSGMTSMGARLPVPGTDHMWIWDVSHLTGSMLLDPIGMGPGDLDLLHGSPPCQGFSKAGRQNPHDPRNLLMLEYARLITEIQPKTFTLEQVPDVQYMTTPDGQPMIEAFMDCIEGSGYASRKALHKMLDMQGAKHLVLRPAKTGNRGERRREQAEARRAAPPAGKAGAIRQILDRLKASEGAPA